MTSSVSTRQQSVLRDLNMISRLIATATTKIADELFGEYRSLPGDLIFNAISWQEIRFYNKNGEPGVLYNMRLSGVKCKGFAIGDRHVTIKLLGRHCRALPKPWYLYDHITEYMRRKKYVLSDESISSEGDIFWSFRNNLVM